MEVTKITLGISLMNQINQTHTTTQIAVKHWAYIAPLLEMPSSERAYKKMVKQLDELLDATAGNEKNPLNSLIDIMSNQIAAYEAENLPEITGQGVDALIELMRLHQLKQKDLAHIASQGVISEIINGKRALNLNQIKLLSEQFKVSPLTFLDN